MRYMNKIYLGEMESEFVDCIEVSHDRVKLSALMNPQIPHDQGHFDQMNNYSSRRL